MILLDQSLDVFSCPRRPAISAVRFDSSHSARGPSLTPEAYPVRQVEEDVAFRAAPAL